MKIAERFLTPHVEPALRWITCREVDEDQSGRQKEKQRGEHPKTDRRRSVVSSSGNPTRAEHRCDVEQEHVPQAHGAAQLPRLRRTVIGQSLSREPCDDSQARPRLRRGAGSGKDNKNEARPLIGRAFDWCQPNPSISASRTNLISRTCGSKSRLHR